MPGSQFTGARLLSIQAQLAGPEPPAPGLRDVRGMFKVMMVVLFGLLAVAVATGLGDFSRLSSQAFEIMFWVVPSLAALGAGLGLLRHWRIS